LPNLSSARCPDQRNGILSAGLLTLGVLSFPREPQSAVSESHLPRCLRVLVRAEIRRDNLRADLSVRIGVSAGSAGQVRSARMLRNSTA
jgi:hypothetical protein